MQFTSLTAPSQDGGFENILEFGDPINLRAKKKTGNVCACVLECPGILRLDEERETFNIRHTVYDRGVPDRVRHFVSGTWARQARSSDSASGLSVDVPTRLEANPFQWHTTSGCALHDAHNALKWSIPAFEDSRLLQNLFNGVVAVRAMFFLLVQHVGAVLPCIVQVADERSLPAASSLESLWLALGIERELLDELVHFRLFAKDGLLFVSETSFQEDRVMERLCNACLSLWRVPAFCGSRWLTIGSSCRRMLAAWLTGFDAAVSYLENKQLVSAFSVSGVKFLDAECRRFMAVCGLSCTVAESFLQCVMKDNRVPLQQHLLHDLVLERYHELEGMSLFVLDTLGGVAGLLGPVFHHEVLRSSLKQLAFLDYRVFSEARQYPWCLLPGDVSENLEAYLGSAEEDSHHVLSSLRWLTEQGIAKERLVAGLKLLSQVSWSSYLVERMHASASVVRKFNPELGLSMLLARSYCHMFRSLLPSASPEDRRLAALRSKWERELSRKPQYISGRNIFVAEVMRTMMVKNVRERTGQRKIPSTRVISMHGKHWHLLSVAEKSVYDRRATEAKSTAEVQRSERLLRLEQEISELEHASDETAIGSTTLTFSSAALRDSELDALRTHCQEMQRSPAQVKHRRERACMEPTALQEPTLVAVIGDSILQEHENTARSPLYSRVCHARELLEDAVLGVPSPDSGRDWYKFVFATLRPLTAYLLPVAPLALDGSSTTSVIDASGQMRQAFGPAAYRESWQPQIGTWESGDIFGHTSPEDILVFPQCHMCQQSIVRSFGLSVPLSVILEEVVESKLQASQQSRSQTGVDEKPHKKQKVHDTTIAEHPWLAGFLDLGEGQQHVPATSSSSCVGAEAEITAEDTELLAEDGHMGAAFAEMEHLRTETLAAERNTQDDF
eukprot:4108719-Amphidinium_carterae.1